MANGRLSWSFSSETSIANTEVLDVYGKKWKMTVDTHLHKDISFYRDDFADKYHML